jgi:hypothetical protein
MCGVVIFTGSNPPKQNKNGRLMLDILFNIFFAFFMGQWEEYHTGLMNTNNGEVMRLSFIRRVGILCMGRQAPTLDSIPSSLTATGYVGITEGQVVQMAILLVTATLGAEAWDWTLFSLPVRAACFAIENPLTRRRR